MEPIVTCAASRDLSFAQRLGAFPVQQSPLGAPRLVGYRVAAPCDAQARQRLPLVLLHGIGSGSASWVAQLETLGAQRTVYAWDAPGYGCSTPLEQATPSAADYARVLADWLNVLDLPRVILVGHSLGAIMAGAFAAAYPERTAGLLLISPAGGYGSAARELRETKRDSRLAMLAELGAAGLAAQRSGNMLSNQADEAARDWVRWNMARIVPEGYAQATHLLADADLARDLACVRAPLGVAVGTEDAITPPQACQRIADAAGVELQRIEGAGHAGYVEAPAAYSALISVFCQQIDPS